MKTNASRSAEKNKQDFNRAADSKKSGSGSQFGILDNRPEVAQQRNLQQMANGSALATPAAQLKAIANSFSGNPVQRFPEEEELMQGKFETVQKMKNETGMPDHLKSGIENLSGIQIDDVQVHYNSAQPEQLNAHAFAQGSDIHIAPGQEKHLPHEAWHVVQQKQGRVKPTRQMKGKVNVNDDAGLENEADVMGAKALVQTKSSSGKGVFQLGKKKRDINRAKKNNPNGVQHHIRAEYQQQNEEQMNLVREGMSRKDAKREAKRKLKK